MGVAADLGWKLTVAGVLRARVLPRGPFQSTSKMQSPSNQQQQGFAPPSRPTDRLLILMKYRIVQRAAEVYNLRCT